jgi:2-keto-4-pentenoate hydratase/2-oxohepta-3-ene-1,7-dioic acid hydratase in catechol pathway
VRLLRVGPRGSERPAVLDGSGCLLELSGILDDITGATLGRWRVAADEVADPQKLGLRPWVNGEKRQHSNTASKVSGVSALVRSANQLLMLYPGDVINTGTPAGVALGQPDPRPYLRAGDVMELEIDGLGRARQRLVEA